jgi:uncharacterized protein (TIGR03086 family)
MEANLSSRDHLGTDVLFDDDPRAIFARAVSTAATVIEGVRQDQLAGPTPCAEYDVGELLEHVVGVLHRVAALGRDGEVPPGPLGARGIAPDHWLDAWLDAADRCRDAWRDDATLTRTIRLPWAEMSGASTLLAYTMEITVHTWDLATATGQAVAWDDEVVDVAFEALVQHLPAAPRGGFVPFHEVCATPPDASPIDRLVAWSGRRP